ncbi:MAG: adenylate kinase [Spirochaetales bacterium]|nr:adenylate kinase [Spirochaetales bacterium]
MKMIFLGPPGAGKGTMASKVKAAMGIPHISTGELFRDNVSRQTELGLQVKSIMDRGDLVPDDLTVAMVKERLERPDAEKGYILDGFPRTIPQAEALAKIVELDCVVNFSCSDEELIRRLTGRRQCPKCGRIYHIAFMPPKAEGVCDDDGATLSIRADDTLEAVQNRLEVYEAATKPLISWYTNNGLIKTVDASAAPDAVFDFVKDALEI